MQLFSKRWRHYVKIVVYWQNLSFGTINNKYTIDIDYAFWIEVRQLNVCLKMLATRIRPLTFWNIICARTLLWIGSTVATDLLPCVWHKRYIYKASSLNPAYSSSNFGCLKQYLYRKRVLLESYRVYNKSSFGCPEDS